MVNQEEIKVTGEKLVAKVTELIKAGNVRKITIKDKDGHEILSIPLTLGVIGAVIAPVLAAAERVAVPPG